MSEPAPLPAGVRSRTVSTARIQTHVLESGPDEGVPVVLVHGNVSSGRFFAELMASLPDDLRVIAPDLRSYGHSEAAPVDATRGVRDFSDDLLALLDALDVPQAHLLGWSVGGAVVQQVAIDAPERVRSLVLESTMAPFGFGGTKDVQGTPCFEDWAGTGGGTANPDFVKRLGEGDTSADADTSPRSILRGFYVKPGFSFDGPTEDAYVQAMLDMEVGEGAYPGDLTSSPNWPTVAPGTRGINNAISGRWCDVSAFSSIETKPPVLWVHGDADQIVSDTSLFDFGYLGQLGAVPGWPGDEVFPPQPMIGQIRALLDAYTAGGGSVREEVFEDCGHSPHLEHAERFRALLLEHIGE